MNKRGCLQLFTVFIALFGLQGCALFDKEEMTVLDFDSNKSHPYSLSVNIGTGNEESDVGLRPIPREDLKFAIEKSISTGHVFERVISGDGGDYLLNVTVFTLEQPVSEYQITTVKLVAGWTLKKAGGSVVWQKLISSEYTSGPLAALTYIACLRIANDGAIRKNIKQGMVQMAGLMLLK